LQKDFLILAVQGFPTHPGGISRIEQGKTKPILELEILGRFWKVREFYSCSTNSKWMWFVEKISHPFLSPREILRLKGEKAHR
jgi:hypothetical protein